MGGEGIDGARLDGRGFAKASVSCDVTIRRGRSYELLRNSMAGVLHLGRYATVMNCAMMLLRGREWMVASMPNEMHQETRSWLCKLPGTLVVSTITPTHCGSCRSGPLVDAFFNLAVFGFLPFSLHPGKDSPTDP